MINLNEVNDKKELNKNNVLKEITDLDIYRFYLNEEVDITNRISSPFRKDENPSFGFYIKGNEILFNDFVKGGGDCIKFVQKMFSLDYNEALHKIVYDFKLNNKFILSNKIKISPSINKKKEYDKTKKDIKKEYDKFSKNKPLNVKIRNWKKYDIIFWKKFGISLRTLYKYNVQPISYIFSGENIIKAEKYSYVFIEKKDKIVSYKIYQPYSKTLKWLSNIDFSIWQGWTQLPNNGKNLIITKSLKDIMCITQNTNYYATGLQNEKIIPKEKIIDELKERFENIYLLYDNDFDKDTNWGKKYGKIISDKFNIEQLEIPSIYESTDISEFYKKYGIKKTKFLLKSLIELPF